MKHILFLFTLGATFFLSEWTFADCMYSTRAGHANGSVIPIECVAEDAQVAVRLKLKPNFSTSVNTDGVSSGLAQMSMVQAQCCKEMDAMLEKPAKQ